MTAPARQLTMFPPASVARARHDDVDTSHEAARSVKAITEKQKAILKVFQLFGAMHDELLVTRYEALTRKQPQHYPLQTPQSIRSRRSELVKPEHTYPPKIEYAGYKVVLPITRRRSRVWRIAQ